MTIGSGLKASAMQQRRCCYAHHYYARLYKAQKTVELLKENQKSAQREYSWIGKTESPQKWLLKSQLQVSKVQLSLDVMATQTL
jgi:hypothetical protein